MTVRSRLFPAIPSKRGRAEDWTRERIERLGKNEIKQLRDNAERLGEPDLAALCAAVLKELVSTAAKKRIAATRSAKSP